MTALPMFFSLILLYFSTCQTSIDYTSDCGTGEKKTKEECFADTTPTSPQKCCYVEGQIKLTKLGACKVIINTHDKRLAMIEELEKISTGVKVNCNTKLIMENTCNSGISNPQEAKTCYEFKIAKGKYCCYIEVKSPGFNGTACREFPYLDINIIGQAVRAAETVDAKLKVSCSSGYIGYTIISALTMLLFA